MSGARPDTWMPLYWGDYLKDTGRLTTEGHGAYLLLIADYWTSGGPLPDDDEQLAAIVRLPVDRWRRLRSRLEQFFHVADGCWHHKRVDEELEKAKKLTSERSSAGGEGAKKRWQKHRQTDGNGDGKQHGQAMAEPMAIAPVGQWQNDAPSPSPSPSPKKTPIERESPLTVTPAVAVVASTDDGLEPPPFLKRPGKGPYVFEGRHIRLNQGDFDRWVKAYSAIPDLKAELQRLDDYATSTPQFAAKWFFAVSGALRNRHQEILAERKSSTGQRSGWIAPGLG